MPDCDVVIVGAGCAGLGLAERLIGTGRSVCLIEPREVYTDDRTWSFWTMRPQDYDWAARATWRAWAVERPNVGADGTQTPVVRRSRKWRYQSLSAKSLYNRSLARLHEAPNVTLLLGTSATVVRAGEVQTTRGAVTAQHVIDTRPPASAPSYAQFFLGQEVQTDHAVFDPHVVQLMQFRNAISGGIDFVYVLPFSAQRALIEVTSFAPTQPDTVAMACWLGDEIEMLTQGRHAVVRQEQGALPMQVGYGAPTQTGVTRMGLAGGAARPSTGYAFQRIQEQAQTLAQQIRDRQPLKIAVDPPLMRWMDAVFLQVLFEMPERGPKMFERLFEHARPDLLEAFLSGSTDIADHLSVMKALPPFPFISAAARRLVALGRA